jgi:hypothetical protein
MPNAKPYVALACTCEKVLTEPDGVASLIRVVDTYELQAPPSGATESGLRSAVSFTLFISLKSGDVTGPHEVALLLRQPNGKNPPVQKWPVVFEGGEHGINVQVAFNLVGEPGALPEVGLYWFDVLWGDEVLTSIPLRLKLAEPRAAAVSPGKP